MIVRTAGPIPNEYGLVPGLEFALLELVGAAAADRTVRLDQLLTQAVLRLLAMARTAGIDDLPAPGLGPSLLPAGPFRPGADLEPLLNVWRRMTPLRSGCARRRSSCKTATTRSRLRGARTASRGL